MAAIGRAASDTDQEKAPASMTQAGQLISHFLNEFMVQASGDLPDLIQVDLRVCHQ